MKATAAITEHGISFRPELVIAILDGRKTQTRRVIEPQPPSIDDVVKLSGSGYSLFTEPHWQPTWRVAGPVWAVRKLLGVEPLWKCPYGKVGDRLYVKETWAVHKRYDHLPGRELKDGLQVVYSAGGINELGAASGRWRCGRFIPRRFARIFLDLTDIRAQELCAITEGDTEAEGVVDHYACTPPDLSSPDPDDIGVHRCNPLGDFERTWDAINSARGYPCASNPWVWALTFRRMEVTTS